ncbi:hypothetical protein [Micromonospora sp. NPDC049107]
MGAGRGARGAGRGARGAGRGARGGADQLLAKIDEIAKIFWETKKA